MTQETKRELRFFFFFLIQEAPQELLGMTRKKDIGTIYLPEERKREES